MKTHEDFIIIFSASLLGAQQAGRQTHDLLLEFVGRAAACVRRTPVARSRGRAEATGAARLEAARPGVSGDRRRCRVVRALR